jgi:hypothetical protein
MPHTNTSANDGTDSTDIALADELGMDIRTDEPGVEALTTLVTQLEGEVPPSVSSVLEELVGVIDSLQTRVEELETAQDHTHDIATTAVGTAQTNANDLEDLDAEQTKTRDVARSAVAKAEQATTQAETETTPDQGEDAETLPEGIEPSSSPLDFFANCRETKLKDAFVERSNRTNTYRAIKVAKRWPEFATERTDGSGVFFTREDLSTALTAELGRKPHRQTVTRVWENLQELGGADITEKSRTVSSSQEPTQLLELEKVTAEGLLEKRYIGLDLLDGTAQKTATGGVTPVVTANAN